MLLCCPPACLLFVPVSFSEVVAASFFSEVVKKTDIQESRAGVLKREELLCKLETSFREDIILKVKAILIVVCGSPNHV